METAKSAWGELAELTAFRRDRFGLVAGIFGQESSEEAVAHMIAQARVFCRELDDSAERALNEGLCSLACDDISAFATKTRTEYARLFLGPREVVTPLHESAYLSGTPRMFTTETLAVRAFYERHGYTMKAKNREPEDAIGVELEFLRNLCSRCIALQESGINLECVDEARRLMNAQRSFAEQHLNLWAHEFAERVVDHDESGFYAVWATYLSAVLDEDEELLEESAQVLDRVERLLRASA